MSNKLSRDCVHVWYARQPECWSVPEGILSGEEQARVARFVNEKARMAKAFSLVFRRCVLSKYTQMLPRELQFSLNEAGKPYLESDRAIHFNVADTKNMTIIAVSSEAEVGVDVERYDRPLKNRSLAKHVLSAEEAKHCLSLNTKDASQYLLQAWVAKEAYLKCLGKGVFSDMASLTLLGGEQSQLLAPENMSMEWLSISDDYCAALCMEGDVREMLVKEWV